MTVQNSGLEPFIMLQIYHKKNSLECGLSLLLFWQLSRDTTLGINQTFSQTTN